MLPRRHPSRRPCIDISTATLLQPQTSASEDPLTSLLASLSSLDPETLKNLAGSAGSGGAGGNGEDFGGLLDGMMKQLMTREILEEPLQELGDKVGLLLPWVLGI